MIFGQNDCDNLVKMVVIFGQNDSDNLAQMVVIIGQNVSDNLAKMIATNLMTNTKRHPLLSTRKSGRTLSGPMTTMMIMIILTMTKINVTHFYPPGSPAEHCPAL